MVNEGTKLVPFIQDDPKEYEAILKLGEETTTDDLTGEVVQKGSLEGITPEIIREGFSPYWEDPTDPSDVFRCQNQRDTALSEGVDAIRDFIEKKREELLQKAEEKK